MQIFRRWSGALLGVVLLVLLGASAAAARPGSEQAVVTLRFASSAASQTPWSYMIKDFERKYPNIKVDATFLPGDYGSALRTQMQAGTTPDVFTTIPGNGQTSSLIPFARQGLLLDLANQPWVKRLQPVAKPLVTIGKHVYAWPMDVQVGALWYNKVAFAKLGLQPPTTWSGLLTLCKKITALGKMPFATAAIPVSMAGTLGTIMAARSDATTAAWEQQRAAHKVTFASSTPWYRALDSVVEMKNAGCIPPAFPGTSIFTAAGQLASGQALMFAGASQILSLVYPLIKDRSQVAFEGVAMPGDAAGQTNVLLTPYDALAVSANTKVKQAALTFVRFMALPRQGTVFAYVNGNVAPYNAEKNKLPAFMKPLTPYFKQGKTLLNPGIVWSNPSVYNVFAGDLVGLFTGQKDVPAVLSDMDNAYDNPTG